jgi:hypothetical protein
MDSTMTARQISPLRSSMGMVRREADNFATFCESLALSDEMRRPVSGRDAVYAPKLSTCSKHKR